MKKSFLLYTDTLDILDEMSNEDAGLLFKAIAQYQRGEEPVIQESQRIIWVIFKNQFKRDSNKYSSFVEKQRSNGSKGGRPKKDDTNPNNPSVISQTQNNPTLPKKADSDSVSVSVSDSDSVNENDSVSENESVSDNDSVNVSVSENENDFVFTQEQKEAIEDLMKYRHKSYEQAVNYVKSSHKNEQKVVEDEVETIFDNILPF